MSTVDAHSWRGVAAEEADELSAEATIRRTATGAEVVITGGEEGVAPGQACVLYDAGNASRMLGGGWISRPENPAEQSARTLQFA